MTITTDNCERRKTVIAGLEAAIRDIECPVQFSPLLMEARRMLAALPQAQAVPDFKCQCGEPLSRSCPRCQKAWES